MKLPWYVAIPVSYTGFGLILVAFTVVRIIHERTIASSFNVDIFSDIVKILPCDSEPRSTLTRGQIVYLGGCAVSDRPKDDIAYVRNVKDLDIVFPVAHSKSLIPVKPLLRARHNSDLAGIAYSFNDKMFSYDMVGHDRGLYTDDGVATGWYPDIAPSKKESLYRNPSLSTAWSPVRYLSSDSGNFLFLGSVPISSVLGEQILKFPRIQKRLISWKPYHAPNKSTDTKEIQNSIITPPLSSEIVSPVLPSGAEIGKLTDVQLFLHFSCKKKERITIITDESLCPFDPLFLWVRNENSREVLLRSYRRLYASMTNTLFREDTKGVASSPLYQNDSVFSPDRQLLTEFVDLQFAAVVDECLYQKAREGHPLDDHNSMEALIGCEWPIPNYKQLDAADYLAKDSNQDAQALYDPGSSCIMTLMKRDFSSWKHEFETYKAEVLASKVEMKENSRIRFSSNIYIFTHAALPAAPFCVGDQASLATLFVPTTDASSAISEDLSRTSQAVSLLGIWDGSKVISFQESDVTISSLKITPLVKANLMGSSWIAPGVLSLSELANTVTPKDWNFDEKIEDLSKVPAHLMRRPVNEILDNIKTIDRPLLSELAGFVMMHLGVFLLTFPYLIRFSLSRRIVIRTRRLAVNGGVLILISNQISTVALFLCARDYLIRHATRASHISDQSGPFGLFISNAQFFPLALLVFLSLSPTFFSIWITAAQIERNMQLKNNVCLREGIDWNEFWIILKEGVYIMYETVREWYMTVKKKLQRKEGDNKPSKSHKKHINVNKSKNNNGSHEVQTDDSIRSSSNSVHATDAEGDFNNFTLLSLDSIYSNSSKPLIHIKPEKPEEFRT